MDLLKQLQFHFKALLRRCELDAYMDDEMRSHIVGKKSPSPLVMDPVYLSLVLSISNVFGFRSPQVIGTPESCGACSGCNRTL
jgi:hypothetical protein